MVRALLQRLKELDGAAFEQLYFHVLKEQYRGIEIRRVAGAGGDEGVDFFVGNLESGCVVWQCKAFPNGLKDSQKGQVRDSLRRAVAAIKPRLWVLCVSIDFDTKAYRWWHKLQQSYAQHLSLSLVTASDIVHELLFRPTVREMFFPHAVIDVAMVRSAIAKTAGLSLDELGAVTAENVASLLDRLNEKDPRFAYEVVFRGNMGPRPDEKPRPGLLVSVADDQKIINVFARDVHALELHPPQARFKLEGTGVKRIEDFVRTGKPQATNPGELVAFSSDFDFLLPTSVEPVTNWRLVLTQAAEQLPAFSFRVTFGQGTQAVVYDLIEFQTIRTGTV